MTVHVCREKDAACEEFPVRSRCEKCPTLAPQSPAGAVQPVAWVVHAPNGNVRLWSHDQHEAHRCADANGLTVTPLYRAAPAEVLEVLEKARQALAKCLQWMDNHGEVVFFGAGMEAVDTMNTANKDARAALAEIEAMKGKTLPPHAEGGRDGTDGVALPRAGQPKGGA